MDDTDAIEPTVNEMEEYLLKKNHDLKVLRNLPLNKQLEYIANTKTTEEPPIKIYGIHPNTRFFDQKHEDFAYKQGYRDNELAINKDTCDVIVCNRCKHVVFNEKHGTCVCHHCIEFNTEGCERCNYTMDEYPYYCTVCDENMYRIETNVVCLQI